MGQQIRVPGSSDVVIRTDVVTVTPAARATPGVVVAQPPRKATLALDTNSPLTRDGRLTIALMATSGLEELNWTPPIDRNQRSSIAPDQVPLLLVAAGCPAPDGCLHITIRISGSPDEQALADWLEQHWELGLGAAVDVVADPGYSGVTVGIEMQQP